MSNVIVYTSDNCPRCDQTIRLLEQQGTAFEARNIRESDSAMQEVQELGYSGLPVVFVTEKKHWSGFDLLRIRALSN